MCWLSHFCCSSLGTSSLLSKWCTLSCRRTKTKWRNCEPCRGCWVPTLELAVPVRTAGARRWTELLNCCCIVNGLWGTHLSRVWWRMWALPAQTQHIMQAWLSSLQSCYLCVFNTKRVCIGFFCIFSSMHLLGKKPALRECGIYCNSSPGMIFNTFQFYYLNSSMEFCKALWTLQVDQ